MVLITWSARGIDAMHSRAAQTHTLHFVKPADTVAYGLAKTNIRAAPSALGDMHMLSLHEIKE